MSVQDELKRRRSYIRSISSAPKSLSASDLTQYALRVLTAQGHSVWRQNNHATRGRKFIGRKGVPDIIGFDHMNGKAVYAEVKTVNDKLSDDQVKFLHEASEAGCRVYIVHQQGGQPSIQEWRAYRAGQG